MAEAPLDQGRAAGPLTLPEEGEARFDPVRWRFIEALARRAQQHQGEARRILDGKLDDALASYRQRLARTRNEARLTVERLSERFPENADELQRLFVAGDFGALNRFAGGLAHRRSPLADLTRYLAQLSAQPGGGDASDELATPAPGARGELKAIRKFRQTWSALAVDKQLAQAMAQAPDNAGPLNSQLLVLRSLALMREISPDYLRCFMSYVDTLLWLDQVETKDRNRSASKRP